MKQISILLPYKENFSPEYAGAVSLYVKDTSIRSKYKNYIKIYGNTRYTNIFNLNYTNIELKKNILESGSKSYVNKFLSYETKNPSDILEIHNRPIYLNYLKKLNIKAKIVLYFHNDPLTMNGSKTKFDREFLLNIASKIYLIVNGLKKDF